MSEGYRIILSKDAQKDLEQLVREGYRDKIVSIFEKMESDPFYPPCEKPTLNLKGKYSRRINVKDRMVFEIRETDEGEKAVHVLRMKGHHKGIHALLAL